MARAIIDFQKFWELQLVLHLLTPMAANAKNNKKRPAASQGGPKTKKSHTESEKKRSRPVTQSQVIEDAESESDDDFEGEDIGEQEGPNDGDVPMQVDSRPKDPNGAFNIFSSPDTHVLTL